MSAVHCGSLLSDDIIINIYLYSYLAIYSLPKKACGATTASDVGTIEFSGGSNLDLSVREGS